MCRLSTYIDVYLVFVQLRLTIKLFTKLFNSHAVLLNIACTVHYCCANTTNILNRNRNWAKFPHSMRPHCTLIVKISKSHPKNSPQMNSTSLASRHYFNWCLVNWRGHSWLNFCHFHISRCPDNDNAVGAPDDARDLCAEHCQQHWFNHPFDIDWRLCVGFGQRTATHRKYLRPNRIGCRRSVVENILQSKRWRRQQLNQLSAILGVHPTLIMVVERARIEKLGKKFSINMKSLNWMRNIGQKHRNHHIEAYSNKRISLKTLQIFPLDRNEGKARQYDAFDLSLRWMWPNCRSQLVHFYFCLWGRKLPDSYVFFLMLYSSTEMFVVMHNQSKTAKQHFFVIIVLRSFLNAKFAQFFA